MERPDLSAVERLRLAWEEVIAHMRPKSRLVEAVFLKANVSLPSQLLEEFNPHLTPILTGIIEQGRREGDIHVTHPEMVAEFLWTVTLRHHITGHPPGCPVQAGTRPRPGPPRPCRPGRRGGRG